MMWKQILWSVAACTALSGCMPSMGDMWRDNEEQKRDASKNLRAASAQKTHFLAFAPGSDALNRAELDALRRFIGDTASVATESVLFFMSPQEAKSCGRKDLLLKLFGSYGFTPSQLRAVPDSELGMGEVVIRMNYYTAVLPVCPDWSSSASSNFHNTMSSNLGCASASNLGMMVADPRDLERGTGRGGPDAGRSSVLIGEYRGGAVGASAAAVPLMNGLGALMGAAAGGGEASSSGGSY